MLRRLQRAQAKLAAVNAAVLAACTAGQGYEPDGHGSAVQWLIHRTGISKGAALGAFGWHKRLVRHALIAAAMTDGAVSESWAKDGFEDRRLRLGVTFGGAGKLTGDLAAGCAAKLQAVFDALGKHRGPDDWRSVEQRQHDALDEALSRLIKSGLLPQSAGTDTLAQVIIPFPVLRAWPGGSAAEAQWMAGAAGQPCWRWPPTRCPALAGWPPTCAPASSARPQQCEPAAGRGPSRERHPPPRTVVTRRPDQPR
jgi:Domain of unknown function (DUF222)